MTKDCGSRRSATRALVLCSLLFTPAAVVHAQGEFPEEAVLREAGVRTLRPWSWDPREERDPVLVITAEPFLFQLIAAYREVSRGTMHCVARLLRKTLEGLKRRQEGGKVSRAESDLLQLLADFDRRYLGEDCKEEDRFLTLRKLAANPRWVTSPIPPSIYSAELRSELAKLRLLVEILWGDPRYPYGSPGWMIDTARDIQHRFYGQALIPRVADEFEPSSICEPEEWQTRAAFGEAGVFRSYEKLREVISGAGRRLSVNRRDGEACVRKMLWRSIGNLPGEDQTLLQEIEKVHVALDLDAMRTGSWKRRRLESAVGLAYLLRETDRTCTLVTGSVVGSTSGIGCWVLFLVSRDMQDSLIATSRNLERALWLMSSLSPMCEVGSDFSSRSLLLAIRDAMHGKHLIHLSGEGEEEELPSLLREFEFTVWDTRPHVEASFVDGTRAPWKKYATAWPCATLRVPNSLSVVEVRLRIGEEAKWGKTAAISSEVRDTGGGWTRVSRLTGD